MNNFKRKDAKLLKEMAIQQVAPFKTSEPLRQVVLSEDKYQELINTIHNLVDDKRKLLAESVSVNEYNILVDKLNEVYKANDELYEKYKQDIQAVMSNNAENQRLATENAELNNKIRVLSQKLSQTNLSISQAEQEIVRLRSDLRAADELLLALENDNAVALPVLEHQVNKGIEHLSDSDVIDIEVVEDVEVVDEAPAEVDVEVEDTKVVNVTAPMCNLRQAHKTILEWLDASARADKDSKILAINGSKWIHHNRKDVLNDVETLVASYDSLNNEDILFLSKVQDDLYRIYDKHKDKVETAPLHPAVFGLQIAKLLTI